MRDYLKFYINGSWVDPVAAKRIEVINPATESAAGHISMGSAADVDRAVKAARAAFASYSQTSVDERFGNRSDFQRFVAAAHQHGMAVIVDAVYGHTDESFAYYDVYRRLGYRENPVMGPFAQNLFGKSTDFARA